jgi:hypothetical protein
MKVTYIDVGDMKEKEVCRVLGIDYTPWYKDLFFWSLCISFCSPYVIILLEILK